MLTTPRPEGHVILSAEETYPMPFTVTLLMHTSLDCLQLALPLLSLFHAALESLPWLAL
jgi:hypothetical protein